MFLNWFGHHILLGVCIVLVDMGVLSRGVVLTLWIMDSNSETLVSNPFHVGFTVGVHGIMTLSYLV